MSEVHAELARLGRDLDALTGAGLLLEVAGHDRDFVPVMLRLIVRHATFAAGRARFLLASEYAPDAAPGAGDAVDGGGS
ncbi:hypothetical protein [Streptomyces sp. CBMA29]|uniref:hypothetical protein n=1 Tax=Streptomyces sp. CBMA29 TaxID=1896314 RepID=UPI00166212B8|nr:hypothetical protein [Streptomyces sp. CBMA29]MBD0736152.1 hypothetical protein [Streptomyces sp. CBMA29]